MTGMPLLARLRAATPYRTSPPETTACAPSLAAHQQQHSVSSWRRGAGIFLIYLVYTAADLVSHHTWPTIVLGFVLIAVFIWLYLGPAPRTALDGPRRDWWLSIVGMPLVAVLYLAVCGGGGIVFSVYIAVAFVMVLPMRWSLPLVVGMVLAVTYLPEHVHRWDMHGPQYAIGGPCLLVAIAMYSIRFNRRAHYQLAAANAEIGRLAAGQERLRIARDLHDLLGHALTTVTVKAELAAKLADRDPSRAAEEMREVAALARQGLADVRSTVAGYREVSLATELATAREVLAAAGIRAELPATTEAVPGGLRPLFGWAVREGVTNAVRHSRASLVRVTVTPDSVEVVDDGVGTGDTAPGSGLSGLAERVAAEGGTISAAPGADGGFRLCVSMPALSALPS
jgi:two-component system sensor histidine kinase DesK